MDTFAPEGHVTLGLYTNTEWMEQYFAANGIESEEKKIAVFLTVIGSKADYYKICWHQQNHQRLHFKTLTKTIERSSLKSYTCHNRYAV